MKKKVQFSQKKLIYQVFFSGKPVKNSKISLFWVRYQTVRDNPITLFFQKWFSQQLFGAPGKGPPGAQLKPHDIGFLPSGISFIFIE